MTVSAVFTAQRSSVTAATASTARVVMPVTATTSHTARVVMVLGVLVETGTAAVVARRGAVQEVWHLAVHVLA